MKKLLLASTAILCSGAAFASDLPSRVSSKAAMSYAAAPPVFTWTGCYVGAHAGAGWLRTDYSDPVGSIIAPIGGTISVNGGAGLVGGGQIGCDYQFASHWVVGVAGDFSWANIQGQTNDPFFSGKGPPGTPLPLNSRTDFLASATGRLGYAWEHYLVYAKGGAAWSHNKYEVINVGCIIFTPCDTSTSDTPFGWTAGAGFEWAFASNWSALIEYDHYGFASKTLTFTDPSHPTAPLVFGVKQDIDVVKLGINYRFGDLLR